MLRNKLTQFALLLLSFVGGGALFLVFAPEQCLEEQQDPTPYINDIAVVIFLIYCFFVALIFFISWLQQTRAFAHIRHFLKIPALLAGLVSQIIGTVMVYQYLLITTTEFVFAPIGGVLIVVGFASILWSQVSDKAAEKYLRVIVFSVSFLFSLLWLRYFGAEMLRF